MSRYHAAMHMSRKRLRILIVVTGLVVCLVATGVTAPPAQAYDYPRTCGKITVRGKRYYINVARRFRCSTGIRVARTWVHRRRRPSGFTCNNYPRSRSVPFICRRGPGASASRVFGARRRY